MPDVFGGHERREERRARRRGRRLVRDGDQFSSDEEVDLERRDPSGDEPKSGGTEPWGVDNPVGEMAERLRAYRAFLAERGEGNGP